MMTAVITAAVAQHVLCWGSSQVLTRGPGEAGAPMSRVTGDRAQSPGGEGSPEIHR